MAQMGRPGLSPGQKKELWRRWKDGQSLSEIGVALGKHAASIHGVLRAFGGIAPPTRSRSERALSSSDREEISRGLVAGLSIRKIAASLRRAPSTISREVARNGGRGEYRATSAEERAWSASLADCSVATFARSWSGRLTGLYRTRATHRRNSVRGSLRADCYQCMVFRPEFVHFIRAALEICLRTLSVKSVTVRSIWLFQASRQERRY